MTEPLDRKKPPKLAPLSCATLPPISTQVLSNGIRLHSIDGCEQPVVQISVVRPGGNAEFTIPGLMGIYLNMITEGTAYHSGEQIAEIIDYNGATLKSSALPHHSVVNFFSLTSHLQQLMPILTEMLMSPTFPHTELDIKKRQAADSLTVKNKEVAYIAGINANKLYAGKKHPLANTPTPQQLLDITQQDLIKAHASISSPASTHLYVAGQLTPEIMEVITNAFEAIPAQDPGLSPNIHPFEPAQTPSTIFTQMDSEHQGAINIAIPTIGREHPDYATMHVVVMALGGYFGSRLMMNLREDKGYTYGISASLSGLHDGAAVQIAMECDNAYITDSISEIHRELERLVSAPPSGEELERIKRTAMISHLETLDSPLEIMSFYRNYLTSNVQPGYFEAKQKAIMSLTPDIIANIAYKYLRPELTLTSIAGTGYAVR